MCLKALFVGISLTKIYVPLLFLLCNIMLGNAINDTSQYNITMFAQIATEKPSVPECSAHNAQISNVLLESVQIIICNSLDLSLNQFNISAINWRYL